MGDPDNPGCINDQELRSAGARRIGDDTGFR